jgi:hypothetical protein
MDILLELTEVKERFIYAVNTHNNGKHGVWTADEYIKSWEDCCSAKELIERLDRETHCIIAAANK